MIDHDARGALAESIAATLIRNDTMSGSRAMRLAQAVVASLPAPTPAAGEAVAWMYSHPQLPTTVRLDRHPPIHPQWGHTETPLYAAPQPPAPGVEVVERVARAICASRDLNPDCLHQHNFEGDYPEDERREYSDPFTGEPRVQMFHRGWRHWDKASRAAIAALANHSPDAGGVGEVWVCEGIPDEAIEAGISAWDAAKHDMENYVSGVTTDWDEGMIVAAIYKAVSAAVCRPRGES